MRYWTFIHPNKMAMLIVTILEECNHRLPLESAICRCNRVLYNSTSPSNERNKLRKPTFFIAGAPKCGTEVFMPLLPVLIMPLPPVLIMPLLPVLIMPVAPRLNYARCSPS
jgi:hypothetical protein